MIYLSTLVGVKIILVEHYKMGRSSKRRVTGVNVKYISQYERRRKEERKEVTRLKAARETLDESSGGAILMLLNSR